MTHSTETFVDPEGPQLGQASRPCILLADDDMEMRTLLAFLLEGEGYEVLECTNGLEILERLNQGEVPNPASSYALVITDLRMPKLNGLEILARLHQRHGVPPVILITAFGDEQTHLRARQLGAAASVDKPFEIPWFLELVRTLIAHSTPRDTASHDTSAPL